MFYRYKYIYKHFNVNAYYSDKIKIALICEKIIMLTISTNLTTYTES